MADTDLTFWLRVKDKTAVALSTIAGRFRALQKAVEAKALSMVKSLFSLRTAIVLIMAAAGGMALALKQAFAFERYETQFSVLLGNLDAAKQHISDLQAFSSSTPFQFDGIAQASRQLLVFSDGALGAKESLKLVGDAAAVSGQGIQEVAFWVGRAYSAISSGRPFGEAAARLQEMALLSGTARGEIEDLTEAGASNAEVWALLEKELKKAKGGMGELAKTGEGLLSTFGDEGKLVIAEFGKEFELLAKDSIQLVIDKLRELKKEGSLKAWAKEAADELSKVISRFAKITAWANRHSKTINTAKAVTDLLNPFGNPIKKAKNLASMFGSNEGSVNQSELLGAVVEGRKRRKAKEDAKKKAIVEAEESAKEDEKKIAKLAAEQKKVDAKRAKEAADAIAKEQSKAMEKLAKESIALARKVAREEASIRHRELSKEMTGLRDKEGDVRSQLAKAESKARTAWEEFKDPELFKRRLEEEKKEAAAEEEYNEIIKKLKGQISRGFDVEGSMFTSDREKSALRVMKAREEIETQLQLLTSIEANTKSLADKIEALMTMKEA